MAGWHRSEPAFGTDRGRLACTLDAGWSVFDRQVVAQTSPARSPEFGAGFANERV